MSLISSLTQLQEALKQTRFPLGLPGAAEQAARANQMQTQLNDYILPRLVHLEAPLLAVVGGSTGSGKSTLVNSLLGREVSKPGVIRPTTMSPVLVHNPRDAAWFTETRILPGLSRTQVRSGDPTSLQLVADDTLPVGLAILDAPDIDSVVTANRRLATQLLDAGDLWLFVTSAARYSDAVPWEFLRTAAERSAAIGVVLNRVPPNAIDVIPADLGKLMTQRGLAEAPLFAVPETIVDSQGLLPDAAVAPIRSWLATLGASKESRAEVVMQTLGGTIYALATRVPAVADALEEQIMTKESLLADAINSYAEAARQVSVQSADGTLLRGEVLERWHDFVGTSEFIKALDSKVSWLRDRITGAFGGEPKESENVAVAVSTGLSALLREAGEDAAERTARVWQGSPAGRELMLHHPDLNRASEDFTYAVERTIRDWQADVMELVANEGRDKRKTARYAALGVNGVGVALMLVIFASTGGLTGAEIGVAGGTTVLAQKLLESIFGDDAVRRLAETAKNALDKRVTNLLRSDLMRYTAVLDGLGLDSDISHQLRGAAEEIASATGSGPRALEGSVLTGELVEADPRALDAAARKALASGLEVTSGDALETGVGVAQIEGAN